MGLQIHQWNPVLTWIGCKVRPLAGYDWQRRISDVKDFQYLLVTCEDCSYQVLSERGSLSYRMSQVKAWFHFDWDLRASRMMPSFPNTTKMEIPWSDCHAKLALIMLRNWPVCKGLPSLDCQQHSNMTSSSFVKFVPQYVQFHSCLQSTCQAYLEMAFQEDNLLYVWSPFQFWAFLFQRPLQEPDRIGWHFLMLYLQAWVKIKMFSDLMGQPVDKVNNKWYEKMRKVTL